MHRPEIEDPASLPDLLRPGLDVVFVGINPSIYSVQQGHYFARRANRFWPAFSRSIFESCRASDARRRSALGRSMIVSCPIMASDSPMR